MTVWLIRRELPVGIRHPGDKPTISQFLLIPTSSRCFEWKDLPDDKDLRRFLVKDTKAEAEEYLDDLFLKASDKNDQRLGDMYGLESWDVYGLKVKA